LHFEQFMMNRGLRGGSQAAMVYGAERMDFSGAFRHQAVGLGGFGGGEELVQEGPGDAGHIARNENIPIGGSDAQGGKETAEWAAVFDGVRHDGQVELRVFMNGTDQGRVAGRGADLGGDLLHHGRSAERQQGFVASHAAAGSTHQNESRPSHEMILATSGHIVELNKKVYICFLAAFCMLAASPSRAAESIPALSAPVVRRTTVVRADPRTGKLVRSTVVSSVSAGHGPAPQLDTIIDKAAKAHDVDPLLVHSIIKVESNYNVHAVSNKGAEGLMQLTPSTARMLGVSDSFDPQQNIEAGVKYLKYLQDLYQDDKLALAAYNAGPGAVDKYNAIPPYAETQKYVVEVGKRYGEARRAADAAKTAEAPAVERKAEDTKPAEVKPAAVETFIDGNGRLYLKTTQ
jgi:soluble lytic murein transglycosylase-like protein